MPFGGVVDSEHQQKVAATSFTFTWARASVAGESCAILLTPRIGTTNTISSVTDSTGTNTWTQGIVSTVAGSNTRTEWWYCLAPASFTTISVNITLSAPLSAVLVRMQGIDTSAANDGTATAGSGTASASLTTGSLTTTNATDIILVGTGWSSTAARTLTSFSANYTPLQMLTGSATLQGSAAGYRVTAATVTAQQNTVTISGTGAWAGAAIAFKLAADPAGTTVSKTVAASADDAEHSSTANDSGRAVTNSGAVTITTTTFSPGSHGANDERSTGARFLSVTIPNAATIQAAWLRLKAKTTYHSAWPSGVHLLVSAQAADNAATFTTAAGNLNTTARPRSTAVATQWNLTSVVAAEIYALDVTAVVQGIVNRAGWASGNAMVILVDTAVDCTVGEWNDFYAWDDATDRTNNPPKLDIIYTTASAVSDVFLPARSYQHVIVR